MTYQIQTSNFSGSLEDLLEAVKTNTVNILDLRLVEITDQLKGELNPEKPDYEQLSSALVELSALLARKSKALLPLDKDEDEEDLEEMLEQIKEDMHKYQQLTYFLNDLEEQDLSSYARQAIDKIEEEVDISNYLGDVTLDELSSLLREVLTRVSEDREDLQFEENIEKEQFTVEQKIADLRSIISKMSKKIQFTNLFSAARSKLEVIVTFLALLELIKLREIKVTQQRNFGPIMLQKS